VRYRAFDELLVPGSQQCTRGSVRHRQGATKDVRRRCEKIGEDRLMDPGEAAMFALVGGGYDSVLCSKRLRSLPQRRELYVIDAISPGIPLC
jgi:hypothetical protein